MNSEEKFAIKVISGILTVVLVIVVACMYALPMYGRYQTIQNERNQVTVNDIHIQQEQQNIQVTKMTAQQKVEEAKGIAEAQRIINKTLTSQYLQHEAIQAQLQAAQNSSHTETIYVPAGPQGIPLVFGQK